MESSQVSVGAKPGRPPRAQQVMPTQAEVRALFASLKNADSPMDRLALSNLLLAQELKLFRQGK